MFLNWMKCQGDVWCKLNHVNLDHEHFNGKNGVYIIWHGGTDPKVVYVGQGNIRDRLKNHRSDRRIQQYKDLDLYVTWATVSAQERAGVEAYLADYWNPKEGEQHPDARYINVNSPWD